MLIVVDRATCSGHARCQATAPDLFDTDDQGFVLLLVPGNVDPSREEDARLAARNCPERAIQVLDLGKAEVR